MNCIPAKDHKAKDSRVITKSQMYTNNPLQLFKGACNGAIRTDVDFISLDITRSAN